jgi:Ca2+-transporting ATPase
MAVSGRRVLAFGVRRFAVRPKPYDTAAEQGLTFVGLVGLIDPPRAEAGAAIATCHEAGIVPIMITGDHPLTARAIGERLGLEVGDRAIITGVELAALSPEEFSRRIAELRIGEQYGAARRQLRDDRPRRPRRPAHLR